MRIILFDGQAKRNSEPLIAHVASHLGRCGIHVERVRKRKTPRRPCEDYTALIANAEFPAMLRDSLDCFGKTSSGMPSRPLTMEWIAAAGLPAMRWSLAQDLEALNHLFDVWKTDAILLKRSDTYGGTSVTLFSPHHAADLQWDPARDLFCPEVSPDDGNIYKIEMFGPDLLLGWMSRVPSARQKMENGKLTGIFGAYGRRELFDWDEALLKPARQFGALALDRGYGHFSLDLMRNPRGNFEVIEVNLGNVAIWWTCGFHLFRQRYAQAIHKMLINRHDAPASPAKFADRLGIILRTMAGKPKLHIRERQGAAWRRMNSRKQEARYAGPLPQQDNTL